MDFYSALDSSQLQTLKPTLFEITSCSQLESLLTPSLRFLLAHYTQRYPRVLIRVLNNFDELNAVVKGIVEYVYLKTWNATFIEKFYGIKRTCSSLLVSDPSVTGSRKFSHLKMLSRSQIVISLFETVGVPYLATKLQEYHERLMPEYLLNNVQIERPEDTAETKQALHMKLLHVLRRLKKLSRDSFFKFYPLAKMLFKIITILLHVLYLSDKTSSISVIQLLAKISYSRITNADHERVEATLSPKPDRATTDVTANIPETLSSILASNIQKLSQPLIRIAWSTTDTVLPLSIFLLKFLEWYSSNRSTGPQKKDTLNDFQIPVVPSIVPIDSLKNKDVKEQIITSSTDSSLCRICHKSIHNPAVIETGYVFCYKCIFEYLRDQSKEAGGRCPVTGRSLLTCSWSESKNEWTVKGLRRVII